MSTTSANNPRQAGASLVELVAAITFVVVLVMGALTGAVSHSAQRRVHSELILAMSACRDTIEQLRSLDISVLPTMNNTGFDVAGIDGQPAGLTPRPGDLDGLPGELTVVVNRNTSGAALYTVRARVRWRGATRQGDFSMTCLMGERR